MASLHWRRLASYDASSFSSSSLAPECAFCRKMGRLGCGRHSAGIDNELCNVFRLSIDSERVIDEWILAVDPPLPLRRKVVGDKQPEAMKTTSWTRNNPLERRWTWWNSLRLCWPNYRCCCCPHYCALRMALINVGAKGSRGRGDLSVVFSWWWSQPRTF